MTTTSSTKTSCIRGFPPAPDRISRTTLVATDHSRPELTSCTLDSSTW
jgi:hypothetical protein